jgi:hypothetical protein
MSGTSGHVNPPRRQSSSGSKVLSALDTHLLTTYFRPDEDGVIDLTTGENDTFSELVEAQLRPMSRRPSGASS